MKKHLATCGYFLTMLFCLLSPGSLRADDTFDKFCNEAVAIMLYNLKLLKEAQAGFSMMKTEICEESRLASFKRVKERALLQNAVNFKALPPNAQDAIRGTLVAYDKMIDEWALFYWNVGKYASQKEFREGKGLFFFTLQYWETQPNYQKIYEEYRALREAADKTCKTMTTDFAEIKSKSREYSPNVLSSGNLMGRRLKQDIKKWPMRKSDMEYWNIPAVYGLEWLDADMSLNDVANRNLFALDEFCDLIADLDKGIKCVSAAYSTWAARYIQYPSLAAQVQKLADSRFAQDYLTASFRETMEDSADTLQTYYGFMVSELNGIGGYKELAQVNEFRQSTAGKELFSKSGPLFKGTNGSTKSMRQTFALIGSQIKKLYEESAQDNPQSTLKNFCDEGRTVLSHNADILSRCKFRVNLDGTKICASYSIDDFMSTGKLKHFADMEAYKNLPPASKEAVKEVVNSYDFAMAAFTSLYLQLGTDVKGEKFESAHNNLRGLYHSWSDSLTNYSGKYKKYMEMRKNLNPVIEKYKKDIEDLKRHINDPSPSKLSSDNALGKALKDKKRWPPRDSNLSELHLERIYKIDFLTSDCNIYSNDQKILKSLDDYAQNLSKLKEYTDTYKRTFDNWNAKAKGLPALGSSIAKCCNSQFAKDNLDIGFVNALKEAADFPAEHSKKFLDQLNGTYGFKAIDQAKNLQGIDGIREMMNKSGLLYRSPTGTTQSISSTFQQLARFFKDKYIDVAK